MKPIPSHRRSSLRVSTVNDNLCAATLKMLAARPVSHGNWGDYHGCVFAVGPDMYFVPTREVGVGDRLYITCDAQKIEGAFESGFSFLALGNVADATVEDAILNHLHAAPRAQKTGEAFVVTRDGKTFRL